ncbi:GDSL-type esterase/lipase family protein [Sphaerisporangium perillae]|uniref:GDSL-type esterase/lipase family protein n=1 Tax=Sphaerisporangium perillae TaxID=2935860 RepID=UPI00200C676C|nr:SGNH/GDSL hydrolase family protein [Sphaerisporangium perillae]
MTLNWVPRHRAAPASPYDALAFASSPRFADQTVRQVLHLHRGGTTSRLRLSNLFGKQPLLVGALRVAAHLGEGRVSEATGTVVTFGGDTSVEIPAGAEVVTDPVEFPFDDDFELAVSLHLPDATGPVTGHPAALQAGYVTPGDATGKAEVPGAEEITALHIVTGVDVLEPVRDEPVIVAFGDSLTDGDGTTPGANQRYPDHLSRRLKTPVLNMGIAGNRLLRDGFGEAGLSRFQRDALEVPGVTHVIVELGINDIGLAAVYDLPRPAADDLIEGLTSLARQARAAGVVPVGATLPPFEGTVFPGYYTEEGDRTRGAVNAWVRRTPEFAAVLDIDAALRDPRRPSSYRADLDTGDHLHPSDAGAAAIAAAIDPAVFGGA